MNVEMLVRGTVIIGCSWPFQNALKAILECCFERKKVLYEIVPWFESKRYTPYLYSRGTAFES